jgi:hypothetical protein
MHAKKKPIKHYHVIATILRANLVYSDTVAYIKFVAAANPDIGK